MLQLARCPWLAQPLFLTTQDYLSWNTMPHSGHDPPASTINQKKKKKVPRDLPTGKSAGDHSLGGFFLVEGQTNTIKQCFLYSPSFLAPKTLLVNQKKKKK